MGKEYTIAQKRATQKHLKTLKSLSLRIKPEEYELYKNAAFNADMSLRAFVIQAIEEKIKTQKE